LRWCSACPLKPLHLTCIISAGMISLIHPFILPAQPSTSISYHSKQNIYTLATACYSAHFSFASHLTSARSPCSYAASDHFTPSPHTSWPGSPQVKGQSTFVTLLSCLIYPRHLSSTMLELTHTAECRASRCYPMRISSKGRRQGRRLPRNHPSSIG
jgi:hypothetical protein